MIQIATIHWTDKGYASYPGRRPTLVAERGHWMGRPGRARVEVVVTLLEGEIDLAGAKPD